MPRKGEEDHEMSLLNINFNMGSAVETNPGSTRKRGTAAVRVFNVSPALLGALDSVVSYNPTKGFSSRLVLEVGEYSPQLVVFKGAQSGPVGARRFA